MKRYMIGRIGKAIFTIWFIVTVVFICTRLTGDPTNWLLPDDASEIVRAELRETLGLNRPIWIQYLDSVIALGKGDLGKSYTYLRPVDELFRERLFPTLSLGFIAFNLSIFWGIALGVFTAVCHDTILDKMLTGISVMFDAVPGFVMGILLIFLCSLKLKLLPSGGIGTRGILNYIMPVLTLAIGPTVKIARLTRSSLLDVLEIEYIECAIAKGSSWIQAILKHGLRNALIPVVTMIGLQLGTIIGGSVVVETVFAWPGIGSLIVTAAQTRDFPVVQYGVLLIASGVTITNLLVDISYGFLDPRIRDKE